MRRATASISGAVLRFDSLQRNFPRTDTTAPFVPVVSVTSASLQFTSTPDTSMIRDSLRFEVIDVDANVPDLDTATIHQLFVNRPAIGTLNVKKDSVGVAARGSARHRVRSPARHYGHAHAPRSSAVQLRARRHRQRAGRHHPDHVDEHCHRHADRPEPAVRGTRGSSGNRLADLRELLGSKSSGGPEFKYLANYQLVLKGSPPPPSGVAPVGGLPSSRLYLRFDAAGER